MFYTRGNSNVQVCSKSNPKTARHLVLQSIYKAFKPWPFIALESSISSLHNTTVKYIISACYQVILWFLLSPLCTTVHNTTLNNGSLNFHNRKNCQALTQYIFPHYSYSGKYTHWDIRFGRSFNSPPGDLQLCDCNVFYLFIYFSSSKINSSP